jgi:hypothetical protein
MLGDVDVSVSTSADAELCKYLNLWFMDPKCHVAFSLCDMADSNYETCFYFIWNNCNPSSFGVGGWLAVRII